MTAASAAHGHAGRNRIYTYTRTCTARATQPGQFSDDAPTTIVSEIFCKKCELPLNGRPLPALETGRELGSFL
jgi:hypothetical protein|eukprot:COSAG06_NODE_2633_length_6545_cov_5.947099_6_plen_73_part_00